ncbi:MAG: chemotaxis protein [Eubacterium sp.]|nr:chemotaxis protein [Eubacterium sp.]
MQMGQEQKKKLLTALAVVISLPVLAVGIWAALITILVLKSSMFGILLIIVGALIGYATSLIVAKLAADVVHKFLTNVSDIADGTVSLETLSVPVGQNNGKVNEILKTVNEMAVSYAKVISSIESATAELGEVTENFNSLFNEMTTAEEDMSNNVNSISENIISQAERMQTIQAELDSISSEIEHISSNIEDLTASAANMQGCNKSVETYIRELIKLNDENSKSIEKVREQTELTNKSAMNIRTATEIIASISNQTNLLALNASIEAARAGEAGKGFAVVAEEIRKLADQSKESTEQINESVNELIDNAQFSVEITQKVTSAFAEQTEKISSTSSLFDSLRTEVNQVAGAIGDIESEIRNFNDNKDSILAEVENVADFSNENEESAKTTLEHVYHFEKIISSCRDATTRITSVSNNLIHNIHKLRK